MLYEYQKNNYFLNVYFLKKKHALSIKFYSLSEQTDDKYILSLT